MSEDKSRKTEQATPRKLREARKKGQVAKSKEIISTAMLLVSLVFFWLMWDWMVERLVALITSTTHHMGSEFSAVFREFTLNTLRDAILWLVLPLAVVLMLSAIVAAVVQFGWILAVDPIIPRAQKINPAEGFKRIFSLRSLVETSIAVVKVLAIALVLYLVIRHSLRDLVHEIGQCDLMCMRELGESLVFRLVALIAVLMIVLSVIDFLYQKAEYLREQRMTREELKRDLKESEGDPLLKGERRSQLREITLESVAERVKRSRILIADVDRVVALHYERGVTPLPVIVAIGKRANSAQMIRIAHEQGIPVAPNARLVDDLLREGRLDGYIPDVTIERVARLFRKHGL